LLQTLEGVVNHDDRAALVCAATALCVASGDYTAVGGQDGWIILPPLVFIKPWALGSHWDNDREIEGRAFVVSSRSGG
jgi:hypothetical protein